MRIAFFGTPGFAVPSLETLAGSRHDVVAVVTQPDRPRGRGKKVTPSPVKAVALEAGVPVLQPTALKPPAFAGELARQVVVGPGNGQIAVDRHGEIAQSIGNRDQRLGWRAPQIGLVRRIAKRRLRADLFGSSGHVVAQDNSVLSERRARVVLGERGQRGA